MSLKLKKIKEALEKDEFSNFLRGNKNEYYFVCPYANMPTDPDQTFDAIKEYFVESNNEEIWKKFQKEIVEMTQNAEGTWLSIYYLSMYLSFKKYKNIDYIDLNLVISKILEGLTKFKNELTVDYNWGGDQFIDGLWGDIIRLIRILNKKFDLKLNLEKII